MEGRAESEVGSLQKESTCGFKSGNCKIGCRNGRGDGQARPTAPMAWMVVIGQFYYWWLLAAVRRKELLEAGEKRWASDGPVDTGRETRPRSKCVGKHVSYRLSLNLLLSSSSLPFPFPLPSSTLPVLEESSHLRSFHPCVSIVTSSNRAIFQLQHTLAQRATFQPRP
jgi:hypothetical protein